MIIIVVLYALLASTFSLGKTILQYAPPFFLVGIRMSVAGTILLGYYHFYEKNKVGFSKQLCWTYIQASLFIIYIPYTLRYWGLQHMPSSQAAFLYNLGPFISYIFACTCQKEKASLQKISGLIVGFCGLLLLLSHGAGELAYHSYIISLPQIALILSITSLSYGWIIMSDLLKNHNHPAVLINGISMLCGGVLGLITSYMYEHNFCQITDYTSFFIILTIIIIISNLICHNLYLNLLKRYSPTMLACASFLSPCFTALYGWLFLQEPLSLHFFMATIVVLTGLMIFYQDEIKLSANKKNKSSTNAAMSSLKIQ